MRLGMKRKKGTVIFVHIPKTAGSTFSTILARHYSRHTISTYSVDAVRDLIGYPETMRAEAHLLQGHFSYGVHGYLPNPAKYITFLRDPVDRVISLYYFGLERPAVYYHQRLVEEGLSLAEFVKEGITEETSNFQVRAIAGIVQPGPEVFPPLDETTLPLAKQRLAADFTAFGLTERFDESLVLFCRALRWSLWSGKLAYQRQNVTAKRKAVAEIAPETIELIRRHNALDLELYDYARRLFEERLQAVAGFRTLLRVQRTLNHYRGKLAVK